VGDQPLSAAIGIIAMEIAIRSIIQMYTATTVIKINQREPGNGIGTAGRERLMGYSLLTRL
jgi:hypothetical protein